MKKFITTGIFTFSLLLAANAFGQDDNTKKQENPKKTEQDTVKKKPTGTRMAINSQGLPTKGKDTKASSNNNRTVNDPKKEEKATPKKEETKK